jgi:RNA ligase (TIGR02306 family)
MFKDGDELLYFEIDSVLPVHPVFEHLRKSSYVKKDFVEGFRLKTIRLRGVLSQGLVQPLAVLDELGVSRESEDLAEAIGVVKWDPPLPACLSGMMAGRFPLRVPKTDQERVQNIDLQEYGGWYEVTEKLDGMSMTVITGPDTDIRVCSRNYELKETEGNTPWELARRLFTNTAGHYAFQGELVGPGIQGNPYKLHEPEFRLFDIFDIENQEYFTPEGRLEQASRLGIPHTPVIERGFWNPQNMAELLAMADGQSTLGPCPREGLVFKSLDGKRSFKVISNAWLEHENN